MSWTVLKVGRLGWLGRFIRIEGARIPREKVLNGKFDNAGPVGKPRTRREDVFRRDTSIGKRGWRRRAEDREEQRRLLREAMAQKGQ